MVRKTSKPAAPVGSKPVSEFVALRGLNDFHDTQSLAERQSIRLVAKYSLPPATACVIAELAFAGGER